MNSSELLSRLHNVKYTAKGWEARCPAHDDRKASLCIGTGSGERILLKCQAGCSVEAIVGALGLKLADLFPPRSRPGADIIKPRIVATYDYLDESGARLFQCVRFEPKNFRQRRPDPHKAGEWIWNLGDVRRVLYRLPELKAALAAGRTVFIAEGEKDCDALVKHGFAATCNPMGAGKWQPEHTETLRGAARVIVIADRDDPGRKHGQAVGTALHGIAKTVKVIELPDLNGKPVKDAFDFFAAGGTGEELRALVTTASEFSPAPAPEGSEAGSVASEYLAPVDSSSDTTTDESTLQKLAALSPLDFDRCAKTEAKAQGVTVGTLRSEVGRRRPKHNDALQGNAVELPDVELWTEPVNGAEVLNEIAGRVSRYVALRDRAADAVALWCAHAHAFKAFPCSPRLNINSPEKGCGKTTLRDVVSVFAPRPLPTENLTEAVLFRLVEAHAPTILADEYDAWLRDNEGLRGLLNAGHRRGGIVYRCEGDGHEVRGFRVFAPAVLCGIGALPGTLHDRSIVIRLERAKPGELSERFDSRRTEREQELCRKLARWCADNAPQLEACDPSLPAGAFNRLADNWRPLFAIAEMAGGDWPQRAAVAFAKLTKQDDADAQGIGTMLLTDIRQALANSERVFSKTLVESLCALNDRPWPEANRGKPISETWLARHLRPFRISSRTQRIGDERAKGYEAADFADAFERYLSAEGASKRDSVTTPENTELNPHNPSVTNANPVTDAEANESPANIEMSRCHGSIPPAAPQPLQLVEELA